MRVGSLFSGVGGLDLGLERAGHSIVWQVEFDKQARSVLRRHWPGVPIYEDVKDVGRTTKPDTTERPTGPDCVIRKAGSNIGGVFGGHGDAADGRPRTTLAPVDLICGGFPCQDYSVAGKRGGLVGDRGALWWQMHRLVAECRPTWVVGENVPGLVSSNGGRDFLTIIASLVELGYGVTWATLDSQYFGVAQRRRRLFIVGHSGGVPRPEILALSEGLCGHPAPSREAGEGVAGSVGGGSLDSQRGYRNDLDSHGVYPLAHTFRKATKQPDYDRWEYTELAGTLVRHDLGSDTRTSEVALVAPTLGKESHSPTKSSSRQMVDFIIPTAAIPRRLTPKECERLQGFPDGWTEGLADGPRYRMMGNAVTVNVAEWIGRRLNEYK
jgi:DNA (cytosine-5)-methyltransferase 1